MPEATTEPYLNRVRMGIDESFVAFYDQYAPKLWCCILSARLPEKESETILVNTFVKAGKDAQWQSATKNNPLLWLLRLSCTQGLPASQLKSILLKRQV